MNKIYNFSAGPAALPSVVLERLKSDLPEFRDAKASVMENSHRGVDFMTLAKKAEQDLRDLMSIPDNYKVLFLQGGASQQFSMVPINLLRGKKIANYANTGHWSEKAIREGSRYCTLTCAQTVQKVVLLILKTFQVGKLILMEPIFISLPTKLLQD